MTAEFDRERKQQLSPDQMQRIEKSVREILETQRLRAKKILTENRTAVEALRDLLLDKKVIDSKALADLKPVQNKVVTNV